jgi:hypothetical protein
MVSVSAFRVVVSLFNILAIPFSAFIFAVNSLAADLAGATPGELGVSPSGSASYSLPIATPVGTTGLQPKITLQYDSLAGNGVGGMGWTIGGLSAVGRCATSNSPHPIVLMERRRVLPGLIRWILIATTSSA